MTWRAISTWPCLHGSAAPGVSGGADGRHGPRRRGRPFAELLRQALDTPRAHHLLQVYQASGSITPASCLVSLEAIFTENG
jgi:hypothetical protein